VGRDLVVAQKLEAADMSYGMRSRDNFRGCRSFVESSDGAPLEGGGRTWGQDDIVQEQYLQGEVSQV
jgi:hypothetical protein